MEEIIIGGVPLLTALLVVSLGAERLIEVFLKPIYAKVKDKDVRVALIHTSAFAIGLGLVVIYGYTVDGSLQEFSPKDFGIIALEAFAIMSGSSFAHDLKKVLEGKKPDALDLSAFPPIESEVSGE